MIVSKAEPDEPFEYKHGSNDEIVEDKTTTVTVTLLKNHYTNTGVTL